MKMRPKIRPFQGKFLIISSGTANIIDADATIKKLTVSTLLAHPKKPVKEQPLATAFSMHKSEEDKSFLQKGNFVGNEELIILQAFSIAPIISEFQIETAVEQTISAFNDGTNLLLQPSLEFLLRLSGKRELDEALSAFGLKEGMNKLCIVVLAPREECIKLYETAKELLNFKENNSILEKNYAENKEILFRLYDVPVEKLPELKSDRKLLEAFVIEKMALLSLEA